MLETHTNVLRIQDLHAEICYIETRESLASFQSQLLFQQKMGKLHFHYNQIFT